MPAGDSPILLLHVERMERYCAQNYLREVTAKDIYRACGLHPTYGATLFRQVRNQTVTDHLTALRIGHAQRLLRQAGGRGEITSVCDVALASGFHSLSRFYEAFKTHAGKSPRELMEAAQAQANAGGTPVAADAAPTESSAQGSRLPTAGRQVWALWVDDAPVNNVSERRALADLGIFTDCYTSNAEAHQALRTAPYQLILSDVRRHGTTETGWEFAAELARSGTRPPLIFYSSFSDPQRRRLARQLNAADFCTRSAELLKAISQQIS